MDWRKGNVVLILLLLYTGDNHETFAVWIFRQNICKYFWRSLLPDWVEAAGNWVLHVSIMKKKNIFAWRLWTLWSKNGFNVWGTCPLILKCCALMSMSDFLPRLGERAQTFTDARNFCLSQQAKLVEIETAEENSAITDEIVRQGGRNRLFWLGLVATEGQGLLPKTWVYDSTKRKPAWAGNWHAGQEYDTTGLRAFNRCDSMGKSKKHHSPNE